MITVEEHTKKPRVIYIPAIHRRHETHTICTCTCTCTKKPTSANARKHTRLLHAQSTQESLHVLMAANSKHPASSQVCMFPLTGAWVSVSRLPCLQGHGRPTGLAKKGGFCNSSLQKLSSLQQRPV